MDWLTLQLADSAFPTGGFVHSGGLEAMLQSGELRGADELGDFLRNALWQTGSGVLVLASAAHREPARLDVLDGECDLFLSNHVANRASRVQGRAFLATCRRAFQNDELSKLAALHSHHAPVFGAVLRALDVDEDRMRRLFLHGTLRGLVSAAIRLGLTGPYQGQRFQTALARDLEAVAGHAASEPVQTAPLLDLFQANHDRLYSRLFQS